MNELPVLAWLKESFSTLVNDGKAGFVHRGHGNGCEDHQIDCGRERMGSGDGILVPIFLANVIWSWSRWEIGLDKVLRGGQERGLG